MSLKIVMYSDFVCPFCYIGFEVMRQLRREFDFDLEWRGFQIHPEWPGEGVPVEKIRGAGDLEARKAAWQRIAAMADAVGLDMKPPAMLTNSRPALAVAEFARELGKDAEFEERIYRAYFGEGVNIADWSTLVRLGVAAGLDAVAVADAVHSPRYNGMLDSNARDAHIRGVSGVPTFFIGEYPLVGAQPIDVMRNVLRRAIDRFGSKEA